MELRELANKVLLGETWADKLTRPPPRRTDRRPGRGSPVPLAPGRPAGLALRAAARRPELPSPRTLRTAGDRIRVLHALANHELLALELFALALLRFPEAPAALRRGWAGSLVDEQRHLTAYLGRLEACGGTFGEEPLSSFFWDALAPIDAPLPFVAGLQVCLEQANLDYMRVWGRAFRQADDPDTAEVLDAVYDDEIRHLRVGVRWLRALKDPASSDFDAFAAALVFPLTPARARGPDLDVQGRLRAGLGADFVARLAVAGASKGRRPTVFWFDPGAEDAVAGRPSRGSVGADLGVLPALQARSGDVVVAPTPSVAFRARWREAGLVVPQFVDALVPAVLPGGRAGALAPWGWSPASAKASAALGGGWDPRWAALYSKAWAAEVLAEHLAAEPGPFDADHVGICCTAPAEIEAAAAGRRVWVKAAWSTAGQHRVVIDGLLEGAARRWAAGALEHGPVVVEPDLDVRAELSVHVDVADDGVTVAGCVRFGAQRGVFRGAVIGPPTLGLPPDVLRFLHAADGWAHLEAAARRVGRHAQHLGYRGPVGVDAMVVATGGGLRLKPISEVNPRTTMGRLALALRRRLAGSGAWLFLPVRAIRRAGWSPEELVAEARSRWPDTHARGRLTRGAVATNEPERARQLLTLAWVGPTWAHAWAGLHALVGSAPGDAGALQRAVDWLHPPDTSR